MKLRDTIALATYLGLRPSTLETWRSARCGPPFMKIGRRVFYAESDVERWLASRRVEPKNDKRHPKVARAAEPVTAGPNAVQDGAHHAERPEV